MKIFIVYLLAFMAVMGLNAQDTIVKVNGDEIQCKVMEVSPVIVKYKKFTLPDGPVYTINLSGIMMIKYQNGARDVFDNDVELALPPEPHVMLGKEEPILSDEEMYKRGFIDANKYYSSYSGAGTATLLTSLLINGLFGLIPAIPCSLTPPKMKNLGYPSQELIDNQSYYNGYMEGARKKKSKKVWMNWAIGTAISTVIIVWASSVQ